MFVQRNYVTTVAVSLLHSKEYLTAALKINLWPVTNFFSTIFATK